MSRNTENALEFMVGDIYCTGSFTSQRHINRIKKLHERYEKDFCYLVENRDGSVCAKFPLSWLRIVPPTRREISEEEKELLRERLAEIRNR